MTAKQVLVIKLGALGDFVQALGPFAAIRRHHSDDRITLLTTAPFAPLARASGYFDDVWIDTRPSLRQPRAWLELRRKFNAANIRRVYDLQTSQRSGLYFRLFRNPKPEWSGIARGCSHPHANPARDFMHSIDRQREQLAVAGITELAPVEFSWIDDEPAPFELDAAFVLIVSGGSAHRPAKRWPESRYAALARSLAERSLQPVLIGADYEAARNAAIAESCSEAVDLTGRTALADIVRLARGASGAVGNDSGPMHLIASAGCPSLVLFSAASDPALCAPRGESVEILRRENLTDLEVAEVEAAMRLR